MRLVLFIWLCLGWSLATHAQNADTTRYKTVDERPKPPFPLNKYLAQHVQYPKEAMKKNIQGKVIVKFMVMEDGEIKYPEVISKRLGGGLEEEALRVIAAMPKWQPGKVNGKVARVYYTQHIDFMLGGKPANIKKNAAH